MARTLTQINESILEYAQVINARLSEWSEITIEEHEKGKIDDEYFKRTGSLRMHMQGELMNILKALEEAKPLAAMCEQLKAKMSQK